MAKNIVQELPLKDQLKQTLEEARVVLPGIQALFGFQLIAVLNQNFEKVLSQPEQELHLWALGLTAIAVALSMGTSALHRQSQPESVSSRLVKLCTVFLTAAMFPLLLGITFDFYLMCRVILDNAQTSRYLAGALGMLLFALWFVFPYVVRGHLKKPEPGAEPEMPDAVGTTFLSAS